jgi:hypothetical protein
MTRWLSSIGFVYDSAMRLVNSKEHCNMAAVALWRMRLRSGWHM